MSWHRATASMRSWVAILFKILSLTILLVVSSVGISVACDEEGQPTCRSLWGDSYHYWNKDYYHLNRHHHRHHHDDNEEDQDQDDE